MSFVLISLGSSIATAIGANTNSTFQFSSGVYRQPAFNPGSGNVFVGWPDGSTVISGAWLLNGTWTNTSGAIWKTTTGSYDNSGGQVALGAMTYDTNAHNNNGDGGGYPLCVWCNELFVNNTLKTFIGQGTTGAPLAPGTGQWWFNTTDNSINFNATGLGAFPGSNLVEYGKWNNTNGGTQTNFNAPLNWSLINLTFEKYATQAQSAMFQGVYPGFSAFDCTFQWNHGVGLGFSSGGTQNPGSSPSYDIRRCRFLYNGQEGINSNQANGVRLIDCEIAYNNRAGYNIDWDAGGAKLVFSAACIVSGCHIHHNYGHGFWCDIGCVGWQISDNFVHDNTPLPLSPSIWAHGIFYEISYGGNAGTGIFRNTIINQPGAGIYVSCSDGVEAYQNVILVGSSNSGSNRNGAIAVATNDARTIGYTGAYTYPTANIYSAHVNVHDNTIIHLTDTAVDGIYTSYTMPVSFTWTWDYNTYIVPSISAAYWLLPTTGAAGASPVAWSTVQSQGVYETHGQAFVGTPDTSLSAMITALHDNTTGDITPQIMRSALLTFINANNLRANPPPNNSTGANVSIL